MFSYCTDPETLSGLSWLSCYLTTGKHMSLYYAVPTVLLLLALTAPLALGVGWLWVAQQSPVVATLMIWLMWFGAVVAWLRAPARDAWWALVPIGLYAGWLTAASSVSIGLLLGGFGVGTGILAAVIALILALMLSIGLMLSRPGALGLPVAVIWALVAIAVSNLPDGPAVVLALAAGGVLILAVLAIKQLADGPRRIG